MKKLAMTAVSVILLSTQVLFAGESDEAFWNEIESAHTYLDTDGPVMHAGREIFSSIAEAHHQVAMNASEASSFMITFLKNVDASTVLDLGSGLGVNSAVLYGLGWKVHSIEKDPEVIDFQKIIFDEVKRQLPFEYVSMMHPPTIIQDDITRCVYPNNQKIILAIDMLPYLHPKEIRPVLGKIHDALSDDGYFIGTLFFNPQDKDHIIPHIPMMRRMGVNFLPSAEVAQQVIEKAGFRIVDYQLRDDGFPESVCFEFVAEKL